MKCRNFQFSIFLVVQIIISVFIECGTCLQTEWVVNERPIIGTYGNFENLKNM